MKRGTRRKKPSLKTALTPAPLPVAGSTIEVIVGARAWTRAVRSAAAIARRAGLATLSTASPGMAVEVNVLLTSDSVVRKLNAAYRGKNKATDVLSFPAFSDRRSRTRAARTLPPGTPVAAGDVAIAYGVLARDARAGQKTLTAHMSHLVVHGVLHLLGYDHEHNADAVTMESLEKKILARIGISDPYTLTPVAFRARVTPRKKRAAK